jgi:riboflavin kinase/FMN adenylyltransferase
VGTFDGVHRGHQDILARIARRSRQTGLNALLVTFDPHPLEIVRPESAPKLLTVGEEKAAIVAQCGIDYMAVLPFTRALQSFSAAQFVDEVLLKRFHVRELVIGYDHHFGREREGSPEVLRELGEKRGFRVEVAEPVRTNGEKAVSSSAIRRAIAAGDLETAGLQLGRPYSISGTVRGGDRRGRLLGFPTVNLGVPPERKLLPPNGVYAVRAFARTGSFGGMMNLGGRPTFGDESLSVEAHLFDADVNLYGEFVTIDFVQRLRATKRFESAEQLIAQLEKDAVAARRALTPGDKISNVPVSP